MKPAAIVVMGVASCGKTTVAEALSEKLHCRCVEGDKMHSPESIAKMSKGIPLQDEDRWPWLKRVGESLRGDDTVVVSCSALKRKYRDYIRENAGRPVTFIHLHGARDLLAERIAHRPGHFMPASLLDSQLATLEMPAADERHITIDIAKPVDEQVNEAVAFLA